MTPFDNNALAESSPHGEPPAVGSADGMPALGSDEFIGDPSFDPLAGGVASKRFNSGLVLIVAVVLVAVAGLFSMRKLAEVTAAAGIDAEIESTIENFIKSIGRNGEVPPATTPEADDPVLSVINATYSEHQVPLSDVARDPFVIEQTEEPVVTTPVVVRTEDLSANAARELQDPRDARHAELVEAGEKLRLKSIMGGSRPMAIIEGEIVHAGDTIENRDGIVFRVRSIMTASVELVTEDRELEVTAPVTLFLQR